MTAKRPLGYVTQDEIGAWLGRSGAWVRQLRTTTSKTRIPCPVPFPEPDRTIRQANRSVPLWRRERLNSGEFEDWFRAHVRANAEAEIATMETHVRRMEASQRAREDAEVTALEAMRTTHP